VAPALLLLMRVESSPVALYVHDRPAARLCFVEPFVEAAMTRKRTIFNTVAGFDLILILRSGWRTVAVDRQLGSLTHEVLAENCEYFVNTA
jgi:hypothetical protein